MDLASERVYLQRCQDYTASTLSEIFDAIVPPCIPATNLHSAIVLLKPNLITARMGPLACTEGKFILIAAKWFLDHGARVFVGDSPAFGTATSVLNKLSVADELQRLSVSILDFSKVRKVKLPSGITAGLATDALECDLLVNMPRVKAHAQLGVTLAVKNLFGCLVGIRKPFWHMAYGGCNGRFSDYLVEILPFLPSGMSLVDGITAMHRTGPMTGEPYSLGVVGSSVNPVALDRAILDILGMQPEQSPLMVSCAKMGLGGTKLEKLIFPLLHPSEVAVETFVVPEVLQPIRFNPFRFIRGNIRRVLLKLGLTS